MLEGLLEYLKEHDIKGIVEWLADYCDGVDPTKIRALALVAIVVIAILVVDHGFTIMKPPRKKDDSDES